MDGPFYTTEEVEKKLGVAPHSWRALHWFAIQQGTDSAGKVKWRCCDNGRTSGTADCLESRETITCERASYPAVVARLVAEAWPKGKPLPAMRMSLDDIWTTSRPRTAASRAATRRPRW
jgi:hypothetical protein